MYKKMEMKYLLTTIIMYLVRYQSVHSGWSQLAPSASVGVHQTGPDQMLSACPVTGTGSKPTCYECISDRKADKNWAHSQINIPFYSVTIAALYEQCRSRGE